jgi:hypothetical protein
LATGQSGIWGGTTQEERHAMRHSRGMARAHNAGPNMPGPVPQRRSSPGGQ